MEKQPCTDSQGVSFLAFFLMWADRMRWDVPDIHVIACHWLENRGDLAVLRCFRGFGKSTLLAVYNAWRYYRDPCYRILHQGEADATAYKTSRDTQNVLRRHPLTRGLLPDKQGTVEQWWVLGAEDHRNASMYARGILSNVTSARADECQNDDVEVPRNIQTPEAREKLRYRLEEQTHILVPGGRKLFIGTPHTHDSLYDEIEKLGADCLTIPMFRHEMRIEKVDKLVYPVAFEPEFVFEGIGRNARLLIKNRQYRYENGQIHFKRKLETLVDCYAGIAWQARFGADELLKRRRETRTINGWDSQYQLHSKPIGEVRLNPERVIPYNMQPVTRWVNREFCMYLAGVRVMGMTAHWDCALGKINSDDSAFCVMLTDERGNLYWQVAESLKGDLDEQCGRIVELVQQYHIPRIVVETNGPGGFVPGILRKRLVKDLQGWQCGVAEEHSSSDKRKRILDAFEPPLSSKFLWAHVSVLQTVWDQMQQFNPGVREQPDDFLDAGAGAIRQTPQRISKIGGILPADIGHDWRGRSLMHDVTIEDTAL